jgi:NADPH2:quinone reductase
MRTLKLYQPGSVDSLQIEEVPVPTPADGAVLVQGKAAAVNPSDVKNVQGKMHKTAVLRIPGRDFAGIIVKGPDELSGQPVFGSGGNPGFGRDGSHAQYLAVPAVAVLPLPKNPSFEQAAGIGVAYITAWAAMVDAAQTQAGETALILGTTDAVGSAAARVAHQLGARVIGTIRNFAKRSVFIPGGRSGTSTPSTNGGELGKALAQRIIPELESQAAPELGHDGSTNRLMRRYRQLKTNTL